MDKNFFKKLRILDGGMGQELHARGLVSKGTLWSTSAILDEKYHQSVVDIHLDYIEAGAELITTTNFSSRRIRMEQNKVNDMFEFANKKACELALKAKEQSKKEFDKLKKDLFNIRFQKINGQIKNPAKINEIKRNIARIKTIIGRDNA